MDGVTDPTADEMNKLKAMFGLHSLAVEDALNGRQVPKVDVYGEQLFVVAKTAHLEGDKIAYGETCIFVGTHHVISVRHGSARVIIRGKHWTSRSVALCDVAAIVCRTAVGGILEPLKHFGEAAKLPSSPSNQASSPQ